MSFGKMKEVIEIVAVENTKDRDGFRVPKEVVLKKVRAYKENKHGNEKWANLSVFSTASALFCIRKIPDLEVTSKMMIAHKDSRYQIVSVEDVREKGMYVEILAEKVEGSQNG